MKNLLRAQFLIVILLTSCAKFPDRLYMLATNEDKNNRGDSYLFISDSKAALVDVGTYENMQRVILPTLRNLGITKIDSLFITHPHTDHYTGLGALVDAEFKVDHLYHNALHPSRSDWNYKPLDYNSMIDRVREVGTIIHDTSAGQEIRVGNSSFIVLTAMKDFEFSPRTNDYSQVLKLNTGKFSVLFSGDTETRLGAALMSEVDVQADILTVPHHGGHFVPSYDFFKRVDASLHLYSSSLEIFRHISQESRSYTAQLGASLCHSATHGLVMIEFLTNRYEVTAERPSGNCGRTQSNGK